MEDRGHFYLASVSLTPFDFNIVANLECILA